MTEIPTNQIILGDCLEVMAGLPSDSIGMILADLPYGTTSCHWDKFIPLDQVWHEFKRLTQAKRACVFTSSQPFTTTLINSNPDWFKYCWVWEKTRSTGFFNSSFQPLKVHEDIVVFSDGAASYSVNGTMLFNPQLAYDVPYSRKGGMTSRCKNFKLNSNTAKQEVIEKTTRSPKSLLSFASESNAKSIHGTQKPVALFEYLIKTYTNEGDVVLDPTAGSMTTAIACLNTKRQYVCIEQEPDFYQQGCQRVEAWLATPRQLDILKPSAPQMKTQAVQTKLFEGVS